MNDEQELQDFIADNPWLLNPNYERVPELADVDLEYQAGDQTRIDLILRDRVSRSPVVVEFKFTPFYRENVGQILEYRARVATSFNKQNSRLHSIFKDYILAPKLALVVKECDNFTRVACNMAGIAIYEYRNLSKDFNDPGKIATIKNFTESLKNDPVPLSFDRGSVLETKIYAPIKRVLQDQNLSGAWQEPRGTSAYFYPGMANLFLNRWLFSSNPISMGLTEDLFGTHDVNIEYYSRDKGLLKRFTDLYNENYRSSHELQYYDNCAEGYVKVAFPKNEFFAEPAVKFDQELTRYLHILPLVLPQTNAGPASGSPSVL